MHQPLVIKIITLLLVFNFISCATNAQIEPKNKDVYKIINNELNYLASHIEMEKVFLEKRLTNHLLGDLEDLKFQKEDYQYHYLTTFFSLPKKEFEYLFNEDQINQYKKQFIGEIIIDSSKLENKKIIIIDLKNTTNKLSYYNDKGLIVLSYPVFTKNKKYSLIKYYIGDYHRNSGKEGFTIYKKENNKWILYRRIGLGIG
ncbi:MAG: hypothetical protein QM495_11525 [Lutibacter sp.]|uniref:hypothetical protein n=1 Tax=Lutibacter sp. TaxID=1925666 RepID=UPI00385C65EB